ncbi:hypothetical protein E4S40_13980 [Algoriphagus kandeliae]|uniref:DUF3352 domain-containing protein n=1 Tax=Algoriphagus kandeliae TaxID=2562278 RepID=A0A4Y9QMA1_9BACT|nr:hypothetical protein [Algoriphagus kandeliae]TFV93360.1 hypothetical protein E4S40_13980 [Algoriphagus kandeliae]
MNIGKSALILAIILVTAATGYWLYSKYSSEPQLQNRQLISDNAVFIFETEQADQSWNTLVNHSLWKKISNFPAFEEIAENLSQLDSLTGYQGQISRLLNGNLLSISYHPIGTENFELLYILQQEKSEFENLLASLRNQIPADIKITDRNYTDIEILEVVKGTDERLYSFAHLGGLLVFSESSFLVEEAIRMYEAPQSISSSWEDFTITQEKGSLGRLWLSGKSIAHLIKGTSKDRESIQIKSLENLDAQAAYDLILDSNQIRLEGEISLFDQVTFTPSLQANWSEIQEGISARALSITQYNLPGIFEIQELTNRGFTPKSTIQGEVQRNLIDQGFLDGLSGELYFQELEPNSDGSKNLILVSRIINDNAPISILRSYLEQENPTYPDFYRNAEIFFVGTEELPAYLFSSKFQGFPQTFITKRGNLLFFANSQSAMKMLIDDLEGGFTWGYSRFPENLKTVISPSAGFSQTYRLKEIWNSWTEQANSSWSSFFQRYRPSFTSFDYLTLRINQVGSQKKSSILVPFDDSAPVPVEAHASVSLASQKQIEFENRLIWGPQSIINYQDGTEDIIVQDENHVFHLLNSDGTLVYSAPLSGKILGDAFQVDYYKNDKLQVLLATADKVYGIDRLGNPLTGYPFNFDQKLTHLQLVDYDNNREYRYFLATAEGDLFLLDKTGTRLDGWNPNSIGDPSFQNPNHFRVPGKGDYMGTLSKSGKLHLFNRRGEAQEGSPFDLSGEFNSGLFFGRMNASNQYGLTGVTQDGQVIQVNFDGEVINRNQLIKDDRDSEFFLIPDQRNQSFLIISKTYNQLKAFNSKEEELFNLRVSEGNLIYQYFDFGGDRQIFVVVDPEQNFAFLYDLSGNLLTNLPLDSSGSIQISYDQRNNQYLIRTITGNRLVSYLLSA